MLMVEINKDKALDMLLERLGYWTDDDVTHKLYTQMYEDYINSGCFDGGEFDVMQIVDNDYVNWCDVITKGEENYNEIKKIYDEQGLGDCSCETDVCSFIEAEYDGNFLIRW